MNLGLSYSESSHEEVAAAENDKCNDDACLGTEGIRQQGFDPALGAQERHFGHGGSRVSH